MLKPKQASPSRRPPRRSQTRQAPRSRSPVANQSPSKSRLPLRMSPTSLRRPAPCRRMAEERLQKILSRAGVASRRKADQYMLEGRVTVNGTVVTELGAKAELGRGHIKV